MGTEEKLYKKIQQAAENAEQKDFPGMEKIWARVEDKMETQTLQKEKHLWKKIAVAASVVLVGTLTFFLLQEKENVVIPENTVTTIDSSKNTIPTPESANGLVNTTPEIKKEAEQILQQQIVIQNNIVINDTINYKSKKEVMIPVPIAMEEVQEMAKTSLVPTYNNNISNSASTNDSGYLAKGKRYDLANSEYNFAVNELSKSSFNQAAIIGQAGTNNSAQLRQGGSKLLAVVAQEGSSNRAKIDQTGDYNLAYIDQAGSANDASISQGAYGNTAMIIQKGSGNKANITQYGTQKTAVVVQRQSQMAIRVTQR